MQNKVFYNLIIITVINMITGITNIAMCETQTRAILPNYIKASNVDEFDSFGWSVALSGNTMVVGARREDSDGAQNNNLIGDSGAAYVFIKINNTWAQQDYLKASNPGDFDEFGTTLAIDGDTIVVGAPNESSSNGMPNDNSATNAGAVYVFIFDGESWGQQAYLKAPAIESFNNFGQSVAISGDTIIIGEPRQNNDTGAVHIFTHNNGIWSFHSTLTASNADFDDSFGWDVAIDGDTLVVGAFGEDSDGIDDTVNTVNNSGAAYVFKRLANVWTQQTMLKASNPGITDTFGIAVDISANKILIGANGEKSNAQGINNNQNDNSLLFAGAAYLFSQETNNWTQIAYIKASNPNEFDNFGSSVAILGDQLVIGALNEGSNSSGIAGNQTDNSLQFAGAAYAFNCMNNNCSQRSYIKSSNPDNGDFFANSIAISTTDVVFGASSESGDLNSTSASYNNFADGAGAVYSYENISIFVSDFIFGNGFD